jgi:hypothetical protein
MALGVLVNSVVEFRGANKSVVEAAPARDNWLYRLKYILLLAGSFSVDTALAISKKVVLLRCLDIVLLYQSARQVDLAAAILAGKLSLFCARPGRCRTRPYQKPNIIIYPTKLSV